MPGVRLTGICPPEYRTATTHLLASTPGRQHGVTATPAWLTAERLPAPVMLLPTPSTLDLSGAHVLIADDVADTGATLRLVREFCAQHVAEDRCAVA